MTRTRAGAMSAATSPATSATNRRPRSATPRPTILAPIDDVGAGQRARPGARLDARPPSIRPSTTGHRARDLDPAGVPAGRDAGARRSRTVDRDTLAAHGAQSHAQPLLDAGPAGLPVVYTIAAGGFDIVVNGDHLLSWGIEPVELQDAALRNLAAWSATRAVDRRGLRRATTRQLRHRRRLGRGADPAARRRRPTWLRSWAARARCWSASRSGTC